MYKLAQNTTYPLPLLLASISLTCCTHSMAVVGSIIMTAFKYDRSSSACEPTSRSPAISNISENIVSTVCNREPNFSPLPSSSDIYETSDLIRVSSNFNFVKIESRSWLDILCSTCQANPNCNGLSIRSLNSNTSLLILTSSDSLLNLENRLKYSYLVIRVGSPECFKYFSVMWLRVKTSKTLLNILLFFTFLFLVTYEYKRSGNFEGYRRNKR